MKNIDFLPTAYRERNALRESRTWWGVVVMVFGTVIFATASVQFTWRRGVEHELTLIQPKFMAATQRDMELTRLQKQIQAASESAGLFTYLQHPWPRTQILASVAAAVPPAIHLHEVHLTEVVIGAPGGETTGSGKRRTVTKEKEATKVAPAVQDLALLRQECDLRQTFVELSGIADDVQQLHTFVADLAKSPIVAAAQLKSLEAVKQGDQVVDAAAEASGANVGGTRFELHLAIKPGYGQPNGPQPKSTPKIASPATNVATSEALMGGQR
jgi:Tfp pilus assembly protein PilN